MYLAVKLWATPFPYAGLFYSWNVNRLSEVSEEPAYHAPLTTRVAAPCYVAQECDATAVQ